MIQLPKRAIDLTGQKFSKWTGLHPESISSYGSVMWLCQCECGTIREVDGQTLRSGKSNSCGCGLVGINQTHGETKRGIPSVELSAYNGAKGRCRNNNNRKFPDYGGRGIEFRFASFDQFLNDLGRKPSAEMSLNRIDNNGHYEPGNVEWASAKAQSQNRRNNVLIAVNGEAKTIRDWARDSGLMAETIVSRIYLYNWCHQCSVTLPVIEGVKQCTHLKSKIN